MRISAFPLVALPVMLAPALASATPTTSLNNALNGPGVCIGCHQFDNAAANQNDPAYGPYNSWRGSMMANSSRDPVFWAGIAVAAQDDSDNTELCVRCHAPRAFLEGRGTATAIGDLVTADLDGVECELCHRMQDEGDPLGNAQYALDDVNPGGGVPRHGPFTYAGTVEDPAPPHPVQQDAFTGSSELCGVCHDVTTPAERVDDNGAGLGIDFNEQRTYSEWLNSDYSVAGDDFASCQDCHLPPVDNVAACGQFQGNGVTHETGVRRHDLAGANVFMMQLLQGIYGSAGTSEILDVDYDFTIARAQEVLATAASLEITAPNEVMLGAGLDFQVVVTNNTGHKLPTGYSEGRVMWLEVTGTYADEDIYVSGAWDQVTGIVDDANLRTYQARAEQYSTGTELHLLLNDHWIEDTRIPPLGLTQDIQTDPVGDRYVMVGGVWPNYDDAPFAFDPLPDIVDETPGDETDDEITLTVRLMYWINTPDYINFLETENSTNDAGTDLAMLFDDAGGAPPMVLAEETVAIPITGFGPIGGTGSSSSTGPGTTTDPSTTSTSTSTTGLPTTDTDPTATTSDTDTDTAGAEGGDDGCACRTRPSPTPAIAPLLLLLLGLVRRATARSRRR